MASYDFTGGLPANVRTPDVGTYNPTPYGAYQNYANAFQAANTRNEQRYQQILQGYRQQGQDQQQQMSGVYKGYSDMIGQAKGFGESQRVGLQDQYQRNLADMQQSMLARGMGNTSAFDNAARGINDDYYRQKIGLEDTLLGRTQGLQNQALGYQDQMQQAYAANQRQQLDFMGQKQDSPPNPQMYMQATQAMQPQQGGYAGGSYGGAMPQAGYRPMQTMNSNLNPYGGGVGGLPGYSPQMSAAVAGQQSTVSNLPNGYGGSGDPYARLGSYGGTGGRYGMGLADNYGYGGGGYGEG